MSSTKNYACMMTILCGLSLLLPGCARYKSKSLKRLSHAPLHTHLKQPEKNTVSFKYHIFDKHDCFRYLGRNVINKGYQPIQLAISNNTPKTLSFSLSKFDMPCVPVDEVAHSVHTSTVNRAVGYGVAGLFLWPFWIPAVVDSVKSDKANKKLDLDFARKALRSQHIAPYSTIHGLIFIDHENFNPNFGFTLEDNATRQNFALSTLNPCVSIESTP